jgi:hypothetical protein
VAVLRPRERLVYFRISEDEFRQFSSVCEEAGARSVSDLARSAVQRLIDDGKRHREGQEIEEKIRMLDRLIAEVTEQLRVLEMSHVLQAAAPGSHGGMDRRAAWTESTEQHNRGKE